MTLGNETLFTRHFPDFRQGLQGVVDYVNYLTIPHTVSTHRGD